jgi:uncharacterized protein
MPAPFFLSVFPAAILLNWIYYKNNRSIIAAIWFHLTLNLFSVLFQTTQFTKCIITALLLIVSVVVIMRNKSLFFYTVSENPVNKTTYPTNQL